MTRTQRVALALIVFTAFGLRLGYLIHAQNTPGYAWEDPDGYLFRASRMVRSGDWRWSYNAVTYTINGQRHALPPLYSIFLSGFVRFPGFPLSPQVTQVVIGAAATLLIFALGRRLHSVRAGLIAAAAYALWVPNIFNVWSTSQETIYVPLILLSFVLLLRAVDSSAPPAAFALAGAAFGAAALTRSMPLFFIGPAALLHVALAANRRLASLQAAALVGAFLLVVVPYSAGLSRHFGRLTIVDTHGSIHLGRAPGQAAPGLLETARQLWGAFAAHPVEYVAGCLSRARSLLHVNGGRQLQIYVVAKDRLRAGLWKAVVHAGTDALLVIASIGAAIGAIVCRQPRLAAMCVLWTVVNVAIAAMGGFSGARLRVPFEPFLFLLSASVLAGEWRPATMRAWIPAIAIAAVVAVAVLSQVPASFAAWPDYGVRWPSIFNRTSGDLSRSAGVNVLALDGVAAFQASATGTQPIRLDVRAGGVHVRTVELPPGNPVPIRALWPPRGFAFVELTANGGDADATIRVNLERP